MCPCTSYTNSCMPQQPHCKIVIFQLFNNDFYIKHLFFSHFPSIHHFKIVNYMRHFTSWRFIQWMFNVAPTRMWSAGKKLGCPHFVLCTCIQLRMSEKSLAVHGWRGRIPVNISPYSLIFMHYLVVICMRAYVGGPKTFWWRWGFAPWEGCATDL